MGSSGFPAASFPRVFIDSEGLWPHLPRPLCQRGVPGAPVLPGVPPAAPQGSKLPPCPPGLGSGAAAGPPSLPPQPGDPGWHPLPQRGGIPRCHTTSQGGTWQPGDPSLGGSGDPAPSPAVCCRVAAQHANSYGDPGGPGGRVPRWGVLGHPWAPRRLEVAPALGCCPSPPPPPPCPPRLWQPLAPSAGSPRGPPAAGLQLPPPRVLHAPPPRPPEPGATRCTSCPARRGPQGHGRSPGPRRGGQFCKEKQRLGFRNNVLGFYHKAKPRLGLCRPGSG